MRNRIGFKRVWSRLVFWFLVISLLPLVISGVIVYNQTIFNIRVQETEKLGVIRDLKVHEINLWLDEKANDVQSIAGDIEIRNLEKVFDRREQTPAENEITKIAQRIIDRYLANYNDLSEIFIVSYASERVEISTNTARVGTDKSEDLYFTEPVKSGDLYIKDIYFSKIENMPSMTFSSLVSCLEHDGAHIIGVLVARINLEVSLYDLLLNRTGMGATGETLIVNSEVFALNELRWFNRAPTKLKIEALPAVRASEGKTGIVETEDYRGEMVLAAYTHIPRTTWGFIAKQDLSEIYESINKTRRNFFIIFFISIIGIVLVALFLSSTFVLPIRDLGKVLSRFRNGELAARSSVVQKDEIGFLAQSFDAMAATLESQIKIQQGSADVSETMIEARTVNQFGKEILKKLLDTSDSEFGVFYVYRENNGMYEHLASIGVAEALQMPFAGDKLPGEFGKALMERKISRVKDIPEDTHFTFKTIAGTTHPRELLTIPLLTGNNVSALIALGSLKKYTQVSLDILDKAWLSLNTGLSNLLAREKTVRISEELSTNNVELNALNEELQSQSEELQ